MRKAYFLLLTGMIVVLALLVDWHEVIDTVKTHNPWQTPTGSPAAPAAPESLATADAGDTIAGPAVTLTSLLQKLQERTVPAADTLLPLPEPARARPAAAPAVATPVARIDSLLRNHDLPEQPFLQQSRELLKAAEQNYQRIHRRTPAKKER